MQTMKLIWLAAQLSLLCLAGCAYQNPAPTAPTAIDPSAPSQITLSALPGDGASAGSAIVTARVQNANGGPIPNVMVSFTTTRGSVAPAQVSTNAGGTATARLNASDTADVTA